MIQGLPSRLRDKREQLHLSRKTVAESIGIAASTLAGFENGHRTPSTEVLLSLSGLYHCSVDYLLGVDRSSSQFYIDTTGLSDGEIEAISRLVDEMKQTSPK